MLSSTEFNQPIQEGSAKYGRAEHAEFEIKWGIYDINKYKNIEKYIICLRICFFQVGNEDII